MNPQYGVIRAKITIVCGVAGARKDFVAGWLGYCDGFIDTHWRVHPLVGHSELNSYGWSIVDIFDAITNGSLVPDADSDRSIALTCHVPEVLSDKVDLSAFTKFVESGALRIVCMNLKGSDMIQYHWDKIVKAYLYGGMPSSDLLRIIQPNLLNSKFETTETITNEIAVAKINQLIQRVLDIQHLPAERQDGQYLFYKNLEKLSPVEIEYNKLFQEGGSYYLCETLGVTAPERLHNYWNALLPFINAPETCEAFGQQWSKSMIIK